MLSTYREKLKTFLAGLKITKIHLIIAVVVIFLAEGIWAGSALVQTSTKTQIGSADTQKVSAPTPLPNTTSLFLQSAKTEVKMGEKIPVTVDVYSTKLTDGTDIIIKYDPNLLSVITNAARNPVNVGTLYSDYPVNKVEESSGQIVVSGISNNADGTIPKGTFGTIIFQAKAAGKARVGFEFKEGSTTDSNIIETKTAKDILKSVNSLEFTISQ